MKHRGCCGGALAALAVASVAAAQEDPSTQVLHRFELDNGLVVLVVENHAAPIATVLVAVRGGAQIQAKGEEGLAHLFEHVLFRAYGNRPGAFDAAASELDGIPNGTTELESVYYYLIVPSQNTEKAIRLLGRLLTRTKLSANDVDAERTVVLDELEREQSDPERALERSVSRHLWGAVWHRRDIRGDSVSLMRIDSDRMKDACSRYYVPNNAAVIVTGDVSPHEVLEAVERHLGDWARSADPFDGRPYEPVAALTDSRAVILPRAVPDVTIRIALYGPHLEHDPIASYAADALFEIINDRGSSFQKRLVDSGMFQWVTVHYAPVSDVGPITVLGKTVAAMAKEALHALLVQIDSIGDLVDVSDQDLTIAKRRREVNAALSLEATAALAPTIASKWAGAGLDYYLTYHQWMNALTLDDLRRFARLYLVERPKVIGILGPQATTDQIADWLRGLSKES